MAGLSLRERLALAHTSMSGRQLAAVMGVSARTVGRWLREGAPGGVQSIPREAASVVNVAFDLHRDLAKHAAWEFAIPYSSDVPVYAVRKPLGYIDEKTGKFKPRIDPKTGMIVLGDRIFIENAQFLGSALRQIAIIDFAQSGKMVVASVGSKIDLSRYFQNSLDHRITEQKRSAKPNRASSSELARAMRQSFRDTFGVDPKTLEHSPEIRLVCTKKRPIGIEFAIEKEIREIERQIRHKHEPAAEGPGTGVGNVLIIQMKREFTNDANARIAARKAPRNRR